MDKIPFTLEGIERLKKELMRLEKVEKPENIRAIEEARSHGDIAENAEYHAAKERQGFIAAKINELKDVINRSDIIDIDDGPADRVVFGRIVEMINIDTDEEVSYQMVGPYESAPEEGKISVTSPLGQALIGREAGDEVKAVTPKGTVVFEILKIS